MMTGEIGKGTANMATQVTAISPGKETVITLMSLTGTRIITTVTVVLMVTTAALEDTVTVAPLANGPMTSMATIEIIGVIETIMTDIRTQREGARMNIALQTTTKEEEEEEEEGIRRTLEECLTTGDLLETMAPWGRITTGPFTQTNPRL